MGTVSRAELIASAFDADRPRHVFTSHRGFHTISGHYQGVFVSVVAIGIGISMMDLFVREARAVVEGPMVMIRFGTCGGIGDDAKPGTVIVASQGSAYISRNPDAFHSSSVTEQAPEPYTLHKVVPADPAVAAALVHALTEALGADHVVEGINITADSFYSSQGRLDDRFDDRNAGLIDGLVHGAYPTAKSMEMESFYLLHLAQSAKIPIAACAAAIAVANRLSSAVIEDKVLLHVEKVGGHAVLHTVATVRI